MSKINFNHRQVGPTLQFSPADPYEEAVWRFIREWNSEQQVFHLHTSGSTGPPKSITVTRSQMVASATATLQYLMLSKDCPVTVCIDARYIGGTMQLVRALIHQLPLQIITPTGKLNSPLAGYTSLGLISLVPLQLYELLEQGIEVLNKAEVVLIGGGPLNAEIQPLLQSVKPALYHTYGMTETLSHIALRQLNGPEPKETFEVLPGVEIRTDDRGCLVVKGAVTSHKEVVTNDVIEILSSQSFAWKGRIDEVVNSGGIKIFPEEIDKKIGPVVRRHYGQCNYFCYGLPDNKLGQKLVLFIESSDQSIDKTSLLGTLKQQLPRFHAPKEVILQNTFRLTASGKIDKKKTALSGESNDQSKTEE